MADPFDAAGDTPMPAADLATGDLIPVVRMPAGTWDTITALDLATALARLGGTSPPPPPPPAYVPALKFNDPRNSMYLGTVV